MCCNQCETFPKFVDVFSVNLELACRIQKASGAVCITCFACLTATHAVARVSGEKGLWCIFWSCSSWPPANFVGTRSRSHVFVFALATFFFKTLCNSSRRSSTTCVPVLAKALPHLISFCPHATTTFDLVCPYICVSTKVNKAKLPTWSH